VVQGIASQIDLPSTLTGLAGLPPFPGTGSDLSPSVRSGAPTGQRQAFTDTWFKAADRAAVYTTERACQLDFAPRLREERGGDYVEGCFDRRLDPEHRAARRDPALEGEIRAWRVARLAEAATSGPAPETVPSGGVEEQLRALGYRD
jgi:hypothetical protein